MLISLLLISNRWQSKTLRLLTSVDQKSLETEFSIAICRLTGDKWQSKTLFLVIFDPPLSAVKILIAAYLVYYLSLLSQVFA